MMSKNCMNCAWYCHSDGNCYGTKARLYNIVPAAKAPNWVCSDWAFDGLEDWEREDTLVTMEMAK